MKVLKKIRYAVVGLGEIAQTAVLPAFAKAEENSTLTALVSGDRKKLKTLGKKYCIDKLYLYSQFEECLRSGVVDAVYVATPNFNHRNIMETAAKYGVHVLCEKPMAVTTEDCLSMIHAAEQNHVKLMIAYRLHFDPANLEAITAASNKSLGQIRIFNSIFTMCVEDKTNIRLKDTEHGGGPLYDIGIYCINAARHLFQSEPMEVVAMASSDKDVSVIMKFPEGRLANFSVSFDCYTSADYEIIGTKGRLRVENGYEFESAITVKSYANSKIEKSIHQRHDQFAPEIIHFSECILKNKQPRSPGEEGLADVKVIEALLLSLKLGMPVSLDPQNVISKSTTNRKHGGLYV